MSGSPPKPPVVDEVEVWVASLLVLERVGVGHQVSAHPIGVDQLLDACGLVDVVLVRGRDVGDPANGLVGDAQGGEDAVVEVLLTEQQSVDSPEELAGLCPLNDAMVVRRGERQCLADRETGQRLRRRPLVLGRVFQGADPQDRPLPLHQAGYRVDRADGPRVGEADGGAHEVVDAELAGPGSANEVFVGRPERREVHEVGGLDGRHQ
jgi:hypothetical protein